MTGPAAPPSDEEREATEAAFEESRGAESHALPGIDFTTFIQSLFHSALVHLGDAVLPEGGRGSVNLPLARQSIELLALVEDKTRGNLTGDEERLLASALYELRLRYVQVAGRRGA